MIKSVSALKCFEENRSQQKRIVDCTHHIIDDPKACYSKRIRGLRNLTGESGVDKGSLQPQRRTVVRGCEKLLKLWNFDRRLELGGEPTCIVASRSQNTGLYFRLIREFARENSRDGYDIDVAAEEIEVCACNEDLCNFSPSLSTSHTVESTSTPVQETNNQTAILGSELYPSITKNVSSAATSFSAFCLSVSIMITNLI